MKKNEKVYVNKVTNKSYTRDDVICKTHINLWVFEEGLPVAIPIEHIIEEDA